MCSYTGSRGPRCGWKHARADLACEDLCSGRDSQKTLAHFNFYAAPEINRILVQELATCAFLAGHENILICGRTGVGNSHLANAVAREALKRDRRVLSRSTQRLLADLHAARVSGSPPRLLARVLAADLLVLDDFGLISSRLEQLRISTRSLASDMSTVR